MYWSVRDHLARLCTNSPRDLGYILATSDFLLALERASPMASQAEGRGFETRRPLSGSSFVKPLEVTQGYARPGAAAHHDPDQSLL
jgi:hypothetical protein